MGNRKEAVRLLSMIFTEYQIYPLSCYKENSPVRVFQKMYSDNYYARDIEDFLLLHDYKRIRRGADLPISHFDNCICYEVVTGTDLVTTFDVEQQK
ncbi:MAG: hypothetical protein PWQ60_1472 [Thermoanaerobacteraceae bacterium]|nr:hypothetical protein [Thermoanaerobacteraceae bacterium]